MNRSKTLLACVIAVSVLVGVLTDRAILAAFTHSPFPPLVTTSEHDTVLDAELSQALALINDRFDVNARVPSARRDWRMGGATPLMLVGWRRRDPYGYIIARRLVERGADLNLVDAAGRTALHYAVLSRNADLSQVLMAAGANPFVADGSSQSAFELAVLEDWSVFVCQIKCLWMDLGKPVHRVDIERAIELASRFGNPDLERQLQRLHKD
jgi:Ankyrin repeats (many copies)